MITLQHIFFVSNQAAQAAADELACFGWVQRTSANTIAGEGRCSKATGQLVFGGGGGVDLVDLVGWWSQ